MRFAGFTETSRAKAVARSLKDSLVFRDGHEVNQLRNESVIAWTGPGYASSLSDLAARNDRSNRNDTMMMLSLVCPV